MQHSAYEFGPFRLDPAERLLLRDSERVALTPKVFETLVVLVERRGHLIEKEELMKAVWPDSFVEEANLTTNISTLRKTLGKGQNGQAFIETVAKRGYRFTAQVKELPITAAELIQEKHTLTRIETEENTVTNDSPAEPTSDGLASPTLPVEDARTKSGAQNFPLTPYKAFAFTAVVLTAILALGYVYLKRASRTTIDSIAVLPFVNASNDPNTDYLADGITESLINSLSQLPQLKVMARSTVFRFKQDGADPRSIGKQLGVGAVMTGKLSKQGDNLIVSAELVNVADGTQLWGEQFNRKVSDILKLQNELSREISAELRVRLTGEQQKRLTNRYTDNTEAYLLYSKGRYFWNQRSAEGMQKARQFFNQAVELDPNYALAYAGLADTYLFPPGGSRPETMPMAKVYAEKALAIDDALAEAHVSLGFVKFNYQYDWGGAEREFNRAIQLNPSYATAHQFYSAYLTTQGRTEESLGEARRALDIDPLSPPINWNLGKMLYFSRRYDEAIDQFRKAIQLDPKFSLHHSGLASTYLQKGSFAEAITEFRTANTLFGGNGEPQPLLSHVYALSGKKSEAEKLLETLKHQEHDPRTLATIYAALGNKDQAIEWLKKSIEQRSFAVCMLKVDPDFDSLRSDARFIDLLHRIGLS